MTQAPSPPPKQKSRLRKTISLFIKIAVTALCFWYISVKIDFGEALKALLNANWLLLTLALLFFVLSKVFSALRLNIYFRNIGVRLTTIANLRLYWLGMFYNLFLPGAISGDAYKVVLLNRRFSASYKKASAAVLLDRFSGLIALGLILAVYGTIVLKEPFWDILLVAGALLSLGGFYVATRFLFRDFLPGFLSTFLWGLGVQLSQVVCIYLIMAGLNIPPSQSEWIFIFLAAAVVTILPLSLGGGLGTREIVFAEGARFFSLDLQTGIAISLLFYLVTVIGSLPGLIYVFTGPLAEKNNATDGVRA